MKAEAGVEFSFCIKKDRTRQCCLCDNEQRDKCEAVAKIGNRYCDDPRNAQVEGEIEKPHQKPNGEPFSLDHGGDG